VVPGNDQFWFNVTFPIPAWDRNQGNIRQAKANVIVASESIDASRLNLVNQAANLLSQYRAARATVERYEGRGKAELGILANANEAARIVQVQYANKITDLATLLQAQRSAIQANSDYVDALSTLWSNATQLSGLLQLERLPEEPGSEPETRPMPKPIEPGPVPVPPK
jgi:cobalt-zinc-cadmium efflux system outer membrane protein